MFGQSKIQRRLDDLHGRIGAVEGILDGIQRRLEAVKELSELVAGVQETAHRAAERADNALDAAAAFSTVNDRVDELTTAVAHGIEHVERVEARIRATVARARAELEDDGRYHPGLEAEARALSLVDGEGGEGRGVPPMREAVGNGAVATAQEALTEKLRALKLSS
jgi:hypothetical protein